MTRRGTSTGHGPPACPAPVRPRFGHSAISDIEVSPDGRLLASAGLDGRVVLWDLTDPTDLTPVGKPLAAHPAALTAVRFAADRPLLVTASLNGEVRLWDITDPARPRSVGGPLRHTSHPAAPLLTGRQHHNGRVRYSLRAIGTPNALLSTIPADVSALWDITNPDEPYGLRLSQEGEPVPSAAFSPDGRLLAMASGFSRVAIWDVSDPANPDGRGIADPPSRPGQRARSPGAG